VLQRQLPELYQKFLPGKLLAWDPLEKKATCDNCAMTAENQAKRSTIKHEVSYQAHLKCCTYHPFQPNYLVGGALETAQVLPKALKALEQKMKKRIYALPIGILPPVPHQVEFNHRKKHEFGNREDWLCPYYETSQNLCGIWKFRGAVCTSFFCQSSHGKKGLSFWDRMSDYLTFVEAALMEEALVMLDFSPRQISENLAYLNRFEATPLELKQEVLPLSLARELWNGYFEDQAGFYKKCYSVVMNMKPTDFKQALGEQGKFLEQDLLESLRLVMDKKP
jgi:Fe-S-cluster containining protein